MTQVAYPEMNWQEDRQRFDGVAARYATYRPAYPETLVDALIALTGIPIDGKILRVGSEAS